MSLSRKGFCGFILPRYVARSYLSAFSLGLLLLTFVLSIGFLVRATRLIVMGLPSRMILGFLAASIPESFTFTIPLAALISALLVFGRMSGDGEVSAMRACGINIWGVMSPLIFFGMCLTVLSIYINSYVAPRGNDERHLIADKARDGSVMGLLQPGQYIRDFPGMTVWFDERQGDELKNLRIYEHSAQRPDFTREIRAESAILSMTNSVISLDMYNVRIEPISENQPGVLNAGHIVHVFPEEESKNRTRRRKAASFTNSELRSAINDLRNNIDKLSADRQECEGEIAALQVQYDESEEQRGLTLSSGETSLGASDEMPSDQTEAQRKHASLADEQRRAWRTANSRLEKLDQKIIDIEAEISDKRTELNRRWAFGLAPLAFIFIGMPLGIRTSRKESNIGIAVSLGIMILYYAFMIMAKSIAKHPELFPHILIWTPSVVCLVTAVVLIKKNQ